MQSLSGVKQMESWQYPLLSIFMVCIVEHGMLYDNSIIVLQI